MCKESKKKKGERYSSKMSKLGRRTLAYHNSKLETLT